MTNIIPHTDTEYVAHLKVGIGATCPVCDQEFYGRWTDYNGEARCSQCGATCQLIGSKHKPE